MNGEAIWVGWWCEQHHTLRKERTSWWSCRWVPVAMNRLDDEGETRVHYDVEVTEDGTVIETETIISNRIVELP